MVYVDDARIHWKGMYMSHMTADTVEELHAMAKKLKLKRGWFQPKSWPHYDIAESKRFLALQHGAISETTGEGARRRPPHLFIKTDGGGA